MLDHDRVSQWVTASQTEDLGVYALLDGFTETNPRSRCEWRSPNGHPEINLFASRTTDARALAIAPRLLSVAGDSVQTSRLLNAFHHQSAEMPRCLLIVSSLPLPCLATRLERRIDVDADGDDMMLRFWDSRIFAALHRHLEPPTREALMGFGVEALVSDRCGGYQVLSLSCPTADPLATHACRLNGRELMALATAARPDIMLGMLRQQDTDALTAVADAERHALARQQLDECVQRQLHSPRDQALALSLAIEHGQDWWYQEAWASCVQQAGESTLLKAYRQHTEAT